MLANTMTRSMMVSNTHQDIDGPMEYDNEDPLKPYKESHPRMMVLKFHLSILDTCGEGHLNAAHHDACLMLISAVGTLVECG